MKIVHLNTYDGNGGAGRAVLRLNKGLRNLGADSDIVCLYQFDQNSNVEAISSSVPRRLHALINILAERFLIKPFLKSNAIPFSLQRFGLSPNYLKILRDADIIHIHWINHGFLAPDQIRQLSSLGKKIVWTLHDSNPITGGCHVRYDCMHFKNECGNCPVLKRPGRNDLSHRTWLAKYDAYTGVKFDFIAPSTWMGDRTREASLAKGKNVHVVSNALETDVFRPTDKTSCRNEFGIDPGTVVILAGYMPSKSDRHKGFPELLDTLRHLAGRPSTDQTKYLLLFYGSDGSDIKFDIPINYRFVGKIKDDSVLVRLYSLADVFLFTSLEESMGYTALESLACGTPVAAFRTSGVTDVVLHKRNGFLAELYDTKALAQGIEWIIQQNENGDLSKSARDWAVQNFSLNVIAQRHLDIYQQL
ncbi:glycosyltransferase [Desertivirga xinjiangensis]|uniref:glycosyltransferase n=1 Tax=Desertivirga xinjiangensis TaxID=539206 RepID=UPI00210E3330